MLLPWQVFRRGDETRSLSPLEVSERLMLQRNLAQINSVTSQRTTIEGINCRSVHEFRVSAVDAMQLFLIGHLRSANDNTDLGMELIR